MRSYVVAWTGCVLCGVGWGKMPFSELVAIDTDWRKQDGIGTERAPGTYGAAIELTFRRGDALIADLKKGGVELGELAKRWEELRGRFRKMGEGKADEADWEELWREVHEVRRGIVFANPVVKVGAVLFVKQVPGSFSHQLTQYYGKYARAGGGIYVLDRPGESLACRELVADAAGSYQTPELSYDGREVMYSYCTTDEKKPNARFYHLYKMGIDGKGVRKLTEGAYDDFSPRYLPDGKIVFVSTRRGGYHRCGSPGCPVYTLAGAEADGSNIRMLSVHETQEWDPAVMHDGRLIYTRWDYVDRHAVFGEHLWTTRPDGTGPAGFYGNYTRNPVGLWEAQAVPGSQRIMATAAAHHAMTAGSIVLVDGRKGQDGLGPIERLTPDTPFPESEFSVSGRWYFPAADAKPADSVEFKRWPGHCYRSPWPLSEKYFLAAYSFEALVGEPAGNEPAMFGVYVVDCFGNKELLHRDARISSLWPVPVRSRERPPVLPSMRDAGMKGEGVVVLQDVYEGRLSGMRGSVKRLRVTQVLPKSTQGKDNPPVGMAAGSPGKAVLGTVPVEADGSAHFVAPAGVPLLFQALDEKGQAIQVMRSATYVQVGETVSCVGCHESRSSTAGVRGMPAALKRGASRIEAGPEGSKPFSYPLLVQGVLDKHCVSCHSTKDPQGGVNLSGEAEGHYTRSYNAMAARVPWSNDTNESSASLPNQFGARGSSVMRLVLGDHYKVKLSAEEVERLATWMDTNALFYGTFDPKDQARQRRGERIEGVGLE